MRLDYLPLVSLGHAAHSMSLQMAGHRGAGYLAEVLEVCSLFPAALHLTVADPSCSIAHYNLSN